MARPLYTNQDPQGAVPAQPLDESEAWLKLCTEAAGIGTFVVDLKTARAFYSPELAAMLGFPQTRSVELEQAFSRVHRADVARVRAQFDAATDPDGDGRLKMELRFVRPGGVIRWMTWNGRVEFHEFGECRIPYRFIGACVDTTDRKLAEDRVRESEARFRATFENAAVGIAHVAPDGTWLRVNNRLCQILGYAADELAERTFQDISHPDDLSANLQQYEDVLSGETDSYHREHKCLRKNGELIWIDLTVGCTRIIGGDVDYFIAVIEDITERKAVEAQRDLLLKELNHRVKNSLATIQAIAHQTLTDATSPESFRDTFTGRLQAIASVHDLLHRGADAHADLATLIAEQVRPYAGPGPKRLRLEGEAIVVAPTTAHGLGLVMHELANNALKYGSLSSPNGSISVKWRRLQDDGRAMVEISWTEHGGPRVSQPARKGFGSALIEMSLKYSLGGNSALTFNPAGLTATLLVPIEVHDDR